MGAGGGPVKTFCGDCVGPSEDFEAEERKMSAASGTKSPSFSLWPSQYTD